MKGAGVSQLLKILAVIVFVLGLFLAAFVKDTDLRTFVAVLFGGLALFALGEVVP